MLAYVLKYLHGSLFMNAYASALAEIAGKSSTMFIFKCASLKRVFLLAYGSSLVGVLLLILLGSSSDSWVPLMLLIARFGLS